MFLYYDLHRLVHSDGNYVISSDKRDEYTNNFVYDTIGNIITKQQTHRIFHFAESNYSPKPKTTYTLNYEYGGNHHAVSGDGIYSYTYDPSGNMTQRKMNKNNNTRTIAWDDEHRVVSTSDNGDTTYYRYDDAGKRIIKKGKYGEIFYINPNYTLRNGEVATKHIFAGNSRIATKIVMKERIGGNGRSKTNNGNYGKRIPEEREIYYYHSDHLGSSNVITRWDGKVHEHVEYFPYGETWAEEKKSQTDLPYKFTGKELDPETGLYYYGARYYDPVISKWISADPAFEKYLPKPGDHDDQHDYYWAHRNDQSSKLPGIGGIFNPGNLNLYTYSLNNPVRYTDPDGNFAAVLIPAIPNIIEGVLVTGLFVAQIYRAIKGKGEKADNASDDATIEDLKDDIDDLIEGSSGRDSSKKVNERIRDGGMEQANEDFDKLTGGKSETKPGGTRVRELKDGSKINVRDHSGSQSENKPTLEIKPPTGKTIKIRYPSSK